MKYKMGMKAIEALKNMTTKPVAKPDKKAEIYGLFLAQERDAKRVGFYYPAK